MPACLIQGHRGYSDRFPENTMLGFEMALAHGAGAIEADVRRTRDGVFALSHDAALDRTTDRRGRIADLDWAEVSGADACYRDKFGAAFAGRRDCRVPRLDDFLAALGGRQAILVLHIKALTDEDADALVDCVDARGLTRQCHFFGPPGTINRIRNLRPDCFTLNDGMPGPAAYRAILQDAIALGHSAVSISAASPYAELCAMVEAIHAAGKLVHASYLSGDYAQATQALIDAGVDLILGNDVAAMVDVLRVNGISQRCALSGRPR